MISAWDIYWVMQLDSINCMACIAGIALGCGGALASFAGYLNYGLGTGEYANSFKKELAASKWQLKCGRRLLAAAAPFLIAMAFIPSTKTAAAMVILPAVANNQAIQKEAGDLYGIAKDALRNLAAPKQGEAK